MSHTFFSIYSEGRLGDNTFKDLDKIENNHLRCHSYWGGHKGKCIQLSIDQSHHWESGGSKDNFIKLDKKSVIELVRNLNLWLIDEEANFDYGQDDDKIITVEWNEKNEQMSKA